MFIIKWLVGLGAVVMVGCATTPDNGGVDSVAPDVVEKNAVVDTSLQSVVTDISPEVLYLLITAEIAGQRNLYDVALEGYLQAAKRVHDPRLAERAAKIGLFLKDEEKTGEALSLWLQQDEKNLAARKIATFSALRSGDKDLAVQHLNKLLQDDPAGFQATLMEVVRALNAEGSAEFVFDVLNDVAEKHPQQSSVFFVQALLATQMDNDVVANEKIDQALMLQPNWSNALILRAQLATKSQRWDVAQNALQAVLKEKPDNDRVRKMLAQVFMKSEDWDKALALYQAVLEREPDDGESQFAIALIYLQRNQDKQALILFKKLSNHPEWGSQANFYLGRIEFKNENYADALVWFDKVTQGGYVYDAAMGAVSVLIKQHEYEDANSRIAGLLSDYPEQKLNTWLLQAEIFSEQKLYQQAFDILTEALQSFAGHRDVLYTRALIADRLNRLDVLEKDLKTILAKYPEDANTLNALGYTLADKTKRYVEAEGYLQLAIRIKPEEAVIIDSLGWLKFKQGKMDEALRYLRKAYEKQPESEIAAHLAEVLWLKGEKSEARKIFIDALQKSSDDEYLLKLQIRLPALGKN